jgi:hypothetical protein
MASRVSGDGASGGVVVGGGVVVVGAAIVVVGGGVAVVVSGRRLVVVGLAVVVGDLFGAVVIGVEVTSDAVNFTSVVTLSSTTPAIATRRRKPTDQAHKGSGPSFVASTRRAAAQAWGAMTGRRNSV